MKDLFDSIYGDLLGATAISSSPFPVENAFTEGSACDKLYSEVYEYKRRINDRLHTDDDEDLELLVNDLFEMTEILCRKMFEYGMRIPGPHL